MKRTNISIFLVVLITLSFLGCERIIKTKETITNFARTVESTKGIVEILDKNESELTDEDKHELVRFGIIAVENAKKIDYELLNKIYPELGSKFENDLVDGIALVIQGYEEKNEELIHNGQQMIETWGNWFENNVEKIKPLSFMRD